LILSVINYPLSIKLAHGYRSSINTHYNESLSAFIVVVCARFKWHPFLALLTAALFTGLAVGLPLKQIAKTANEGFGNMMTHIGLIVVLGPSSARYLKRVALPSESPMALSGFLGKTDRY
jgi:predicted histidine transporter YuiF (NhaC family)